MNDMHSILATFAKLDSGHSNAIFVNPNTLAERDEGKHNNATTGFAALAKKAGGGEKGARIAGAQHAYMKKHHQLESEDDPAEKGEYDREGEQAEDDLDTAKSAAEELQSIIDSDENLPEWVQAKITKAMDYLDTSRDYLKAQQDDVDVCDDCGMADCECDDHDEESEHIAECFDTAMGPQEQESGMNVTTTADTKTGRKSITVTADGEAANELMAILKMAGLGGGHQEEMDEEYSNEPNTQVADAHTQLVSMSGGPNHLQTMKKHGYQQGDNPLAMQEEVQKMAARLQSKFKG